MASKEQIQQAIDEWNTINDIDLYIPLYQIYNELFNLTFNNKLECLDYYIDDDGLMLAEIKNTWQLELSERYEKHLNLLNRIKNNDKTLLYADKHVITENGQLSLFGDSI